MTKMFKQLSTRAQILAAAAVAGIVATGCASVSKYSDGTYKAIGTYKSPAGDDQVTISLTLVGDIITDASLEPKTEHEISKAKQEMYVKGFKEQVVGKSIETVSISALSGASLTPQGITDAFEKIKLQAKVQ